MSKELVLSSSFDIMKKKRKNRILPEQKSVSLVALLGTINDPRRGQGKMHSLDHILIIIIMALMSGYFGVRATGDFVEKHEKELIALLKPRIKRLPAAEMESTSRTCYQDVPHLALYLFP